MTSRSNSGASREDRLAARLRENLKRRKQQARSRAGSGRQADDSGDVGEGKNRRKE